MKAEALVNKELFEKFFPMFESDVWKKSEESDDKTVTSYAGKMDDGKLMGKGIGHIPFKPEKIYKFYLKLENKPLYDEHFMDGKIFDKVVDKTNNCEFFNSWMKRGNVKVIQPRDSVNAYAKFYIGDAIYLVAHSITHPDYPETPDAVRAVLDFLVAEWKPGADGKGCTFSRIFRADPKGSIPDFVKNLVIKRSGMEMIDLRKAMLE